MQEIGGLVLGIVSCSNRSTTLADYKKQRNKLKGSRDPQGNTSRNTYLTPIIPLGIHIIVYNLGLELLGTHIDDGIGVRLALAQHTDVLLHQVLGLNHMNAQNALKRYYNI